MAHATDETNDLLARAQSRQRAQGGFHVAGMGEVQDACAVELFEIVAEQRAPGGVEPNRAAVAVKDRQQVKIRVEEGIELVDVVAQVFLGPSARGDVVVGRHHAHAGQGRGRHLEPDGVAIGAFHPDLFVGQHAMFAKCTRAGVFSWGQRGTVGVQKRKIEFPGATQAQQIVGRLVCFEDFPLAVRHHDAEGQVVKKAGRHAIAPCGYAADGVR